MQKKKKREIRVGKWKKVVNKDSQINFGCNLKTLVLNNLYTIYFEPSLSIFYIP